MHHFFKSTHIKDPHVVSLMSISQTPTEALNWVSNIVRL